MMEVRHMAPITGGLLDRTRRLNERLEAAERLADVLDRELRRNGWPEQNGRVVLPHVAMGRVELTQALLDYRRAGEEI